MSSIQMDLTAEMEGGQSFTVTADQRDMAAWEAQPFGGPVLSLDAISMTFLRFMCWSAANRQGVYKSGWTTFNRECIEATAPEPPEASDADAGGVDLEVPPATGAVDPGQSEPSGQHWFASPGEPANR